jgi:hypothetical protein
MKIEKALEETIRELKKSRMDPNVLRIVVVAMKLLRAYVLKK